MFKHSPKFVSDLEKSITNELKSIEAPRTEHMEAKQLFLDRILQVYSKAFHKLIEKSVTFKDLLTSVKKAYDDALTIRDGRIRMFLIHDELFGISSNKKNRDETVERLQNENQIQALEYRKLLEEFNQLKKQTDDLKTEMCSDHFELMKERNVRYTLYFENVKLHTKINDLSGTRQFTPGAGDPVILRIALDKCREQLKITQKRLKQMEDEYADTVPRNSYDTLEMKHLDCLKLLEKTQLGYRTLEEKHNKLLAQNKSLKEEISDVKDRCFELERAGTPRPQWEICADFIGGGKERWKQLKEGLTSREILRVILKELGPAAKIENLEYFDGLGSDPVIPPYLQYDGKVRNIRLSRRELSVIINDIWLGKIEHGKGLTLQDFVTKYFEERYQQPSVRAEWAYNLSSGIEQMLDDPQIKLFCGVLQGHLCEDIYVEHRVEWYKFRDNLRSQSKIENLSVEEFEKVAKATFPLKSEVDIKNLLDVAKKQLKMKSTITDIDIEKLFQENEEGFDRLDLAREMYRQRQLAQDKYIREIVAELGGKKAPNKMISVENLKRALVIIDPAIDHLRMEKYIRWAFSDKKSDLSMIGPISLKVLTAKLASGNIERIGPRYKGRRPRKVVK